MYKITIAVIEYKYGRHVYEYETGKWSQTNMKREEEWQKSTIYRIEQTYSEKMLAHWKKHINWYFVWRERGESFYMDVDKMNFPFPLKTVAVDKQYQN